MPPGATDFTYTQFVQRMIRLMGPHAQLADIAKMVRLEEEVNIEVQDKSEEMDLLIEGASEDSEADAQKDFEQRRGDTAQLLEVMKELDRDRSVVINKTEFHLMGVKRIELEVNSLLATLATNVSRPGVANEEIS